MLRKMLVVVGALFVVSASLLPGHSADLEAEQARAKKLLAETESYVRSAASSGKIPSPTRISPNPPAQSKPPKEENAFSAKLKEPLLGDNVVRYALIIGIDHYGEDIPSLRGCVSDAKRIDQLLTTKFEFKEDNNYRRLLLNGEATYAKIKKAAEDLAARAAEEPNCVFVVYFSGYGSLVDANAPNGDRTFVAADSRNAAPAKDILDRELASWLSPVKKNVTVILDCSHVQPKTTKHAQVRALKPAVPAMAAPPVMPPLEVRLEDAPCTILAASARDGNAHEICDPDTGEFYGAFTHFLLTEAQRLPPRESTTLPEIMQRVSAQVRGVCPSQQPRLRGKWAQDGRFCDLAVLVSDPFADAFSLPTGMEIDVGSLHGVTIGSQFEIYKLNGRNLEPGTGIVTATVTDVDSELSVATVPGDAPASDEKFKAVLRKRKFGNQRSGIYLDSVTGVALKNKLRAVHAYSEPGKAFTPRYRDLFDLAEVPAEATWIVQETTGMDFKALYAPKYPWARLESAGPDRLLVLLAADGSLLADPIPILKDGSHIDSLLAQLVRWEKWRRLLELSSSSPPSRLGARFSWQRSAGALVSQAEIVQTGAADISLQVKNDGAHTLSFALLDLHSDGAVEVLYPLPQTTGLAAGATLKLACKLLPIPGRDESSHYLKLIYTTRSVDFHLLRGIDRLPASADPFAKLLIQRSLVGRYADVDALDLADWATDLKVVKIQK